MFALRKAQQRLADAKSSQACPTAFNNLMDARGFIETARLHAQSVGPESGRGRLAKMRAAVDRVHDQVDAATRGFAKGPCLKSSPYDGALGRRRGR